MAGLVERNDTRRYEIEKKKYKRTLLITSIVGIIAVVLIFAYLLNSFFNKSYYGYEVMKTVKRTDSNTVKYLQYKSGLLKYSRDGAEALDSSGNVLWNGSYEMKEPEADICGDFVAVADIGGKEVYIFNGKDSGKRVETTLPILKAQVAAQGVVALLLEDKSSNLISIQDPYDLTQPVKAELPTNVSTDGYPVDISLSDDGVKLATSYFNISNGVIESNVSFYDFGEVGADKVNNLVSGKKYGKMLIPKVEFLNNDTACVFGEQGFSIFGNMEQPREIYKETFKKEIKSILYSSEYIGFVLESYDKEEKKELLVYNQKGKKILEQQIDYDYDQVYISGKEITFYSNMECTVLRLNGNEKFHYTFDKSIDYFMPVNHYEKYLLIDKVNIEEIKLTKGER